MVFQHYALYPHLSVFDNIAFALRTRRIESAEIDAAIAANPSCRQIILGKAAALSTIDRWFAACAASATGSGFAIGRSVF